MHKKTLKKVIKSAQSLDLKKEFDECAGDSAKTWKVLNKIFKQGKNEHQSKTIQLKNEQGQIISDPKVVADKLNTHFVTKRLNLAEKLPPSNLPFDKYMGPRMSNCIPLTDITVEEITKIIDKLRANKASGHDRISPKIVKWLGEALAPILAIIFNNFFKAGKYPKSCKIAKVTPLPKVGDTYDCDNPISDLSQ